MPEDMPGRMPEDMPDRMPGPDRMPEDMSDRMPEDLPVTNPINAMVGITRSKVILFKFCCLDFYCISKADLQVAVAFLPGRIADSHIATVARHLVSAVGSVSERAGLLSSPVARLTGELGETWRDVGVAGFRFRFFISMILIQRAFNLILEGGIPLHDFHFSNFSTIENVLLCCFPAIGDYSNLI